MNKNNWSQQEAMMAGAYKNIAQSLSQIQMYMKNHLNMVKNGDGIINEGDLEEVLKQLAEMINNNLRNVSQGRVSFNIENLPSPTNSTSNTSPTQSQSPNIGLSDSILPKYNTIKESKNKKIVRLTESQLHNIIAESVKRVINEGYGVSARDLMDYFGISREEWNNMSEGEREELYHEFLDSEWDNGHY